MQDLEFTGPKTREPQARDLQLDLPKLRRKCGESILIQLIDGMFRLHKAFGAGSKTSLGIFRTVV